MEAEGRASSSGQTMPRSDAGPSFLTIDDGTNDLMDLAVLRRVGTREAGRKSGREALLDGLEGPLNGDWPPEGRSSQRPSEAAARASDQHSMHHQLVSCRSEAYLLSILRDGERCCDGSGEGRETEEESFEEVERELKISQAAPSRIIDADWPACCTAFAPATLPDWEKSPHSTTRYVPRLVQSPRAVVSCNGLEAASIDTESGTISTPDPGPVSSALTRGHPHVYMV
jgi:hypothetical protein